MHLWLWLFDSFVCFRRTHDYVTGIGVNEEETRQQNIDVHASKTWIKMLGSTAVTVPFLLVPRGSTAAIFIMGVQ